MVGVWLRGLWIEGQAGLGAESVDEFGWGSAAETSPGDAKPAIEQRRHHDHRRSAPSPGTQASQARVLAGQGAITRPGLLIGEGLETSDAGIFARTSVPSPAGRGGPGGTSALVNMPVAADRCLMSPDATEGVPERSTCGQHPPLPGRFTTSGLA